MILTDTNKPVREAMELWDPFVSLIESSENFILSTHENSDGDGLGSESALAGVLRQLGKNVTILNPTPIPKNYQFLPLLRDAEIFAESYQGHKRLLSDADAFFLLDTNRLSRTRGIEPLVRHNREHGMLRVVCIDHHLDPEDFSDLAICQSYAAATGELVYELVKALEQHYATPLITREVAVGLYTAIMTDTASFKLPKTSPHLHRITAELLDTGITPMSIHEKIYNTYTVGVMQLIGTSMQSVVQIANGKVSFISVTQSLLKKTGTGIADTEKLTEYLMGMPETELGILFIELPDGKTKISFRSRGDIAVNKLAAQYGGGGHKNAAGCTAPFPLETAIKTISAEASSIVSLSSALFN
ncbi:MAG: bifunctional oligoribonuclease/PAP phosphatase NrnA [Chloroherpetonaceae bacterium]|nr:bifunctional oligoribonuclease/PAP phosphatase NrnA [Chloroherpetonaceae bacterium]